MAVIKMMTYKGAELTFLNRDKLVRLSCYRILSTGLLPDPERGKRGETREKRGKTRGERGENEGKTREERGKNEGRTRENARLQLTERVLQARGGVVEVVTCANPFGASHHVGRNFAEFLLI